jgi:hypothetical protein
MTAALCLLAFLQADPLLDWMNRQAQAMLDARDHAVAALRTPEEARARQQQVRETVVRLLGGLPETTAPLNPHVTGTLRRNGYRVEKLYFESLPGYSVTANLYVPDAPGRHPAVLYSMGHWMFGKSIAQLMASQLALKGFVVLVYDPVGQGERLQAYDARVSASLGGGATSQHELNGAQAFLTGFGLTRWFIHDSRRALDYLLTRPEVDAKRVGATGCSGGGTQTTFLAALEPRLAAAAPACYINSFHEVFPGPTGDPEQSPHGFIAEGLDQADLIEAFAPRPYLIGSTEKDFFPIAGARRAYQDAQRFYSIFGAGDKIGQVVGPGGHGTPKEVREEIYAFFLKYLGDLAVSALEQPADLFGDLDYQVTKTGQVADSLRSRELSAVIASEAESRLKAGSIADLRMEIRRWTEEPPPALAPALEMLEPKGPARGEAFLVVQPWRWREPIVDTLLARGYPVLLVRPRGTPLQEASGLNGLPGDWLAVTRASLIGLSLTGLRVRDILSGVDFLAHRPAVTRIYGYGRRSAGIWLLYAAAVEPRLTAMWLHESPVSLRDAIRAPIHKNLFDIAIPGFALRWDLADVRRAVAPRFVLWTDPVNPMGVVTRFDGDFEYRPWDQADADYLDRFLTRAH